MEDVSSGVREGLEDRREDVRSARREVVGRYVPAVAGVASVLARWKSVMAVLVQRHHICVQPHVAHP